MSKRYYCWNKSFAIDTGHYVIAENEREAAAKFAADEDCDTWEVTVQPHREDVYD